MFYITQDGQIYSGDCQNGDRQLTADEVTLVRSGKYAIIDLRVVDPSEQVGYTQTQRINEINDSIEQTQAELDKWDLKTIRALREGGNMEDGTPYLDYYQSEINALRARMSDLNNEKAQLEQELQELLSQDEG
ncbi:hypothetical protein IKQ21_09445 [bacterium]|nr:hypothetical protein [bacterium]